MIYKDADIREIFKKNRNGIVGYVRTANKENSIMEIEHQRNIINKYCNKYNIKVKYFFIDNGYSGLNYNRPKFQEIMNSEKYKVILVSDISKIGRNVVKGIELIQEKDKIFIAVNDLIVIEKFKEEV